MTATTMTCCDPTLVVATNGFLLLRLAMLGQQTRKRLAFMQMGLADSDSAAGAGSYGVLA